jgi:ATP adenylyltransferase
MVEKDAGMERMWTPWRSAYVGGEPVPGCVFCGRAGQADDAASLIVLRADCCFVIMNLYPYNTGHVMIVPYRHVADPGDLSPAEWHEMVDLLPRLTAALKAIMKPDGFNIGMNVGTAAGAGIADHLHLHVVPRWAGDTNFMPVLGATKVLPELLPDTWARLRRVLGAEEPGSEGEAGVAADAVAIAEMVYTPDQPASGEQVVESPAEDMPAEAVGAVAEPESHAAPAVEQAAAEPVAPALPPVRQAGAIVLLRDKVALRLAKDGTWVLPKGHLEEGETPEQAAVREVDEEMGLTGTLGPVAGELRFVQGGREREVVYFILHAARPLPSWGQHLGRDTFLFSPREAVERLTHPEARALLSRALEGDRGSRRR